MEKLLEFSKLADKNSIQSHEVMVQMRAMAPRYLGDDLHCTYDEESERLAGDVIDHFGFQSEGDAESRWWWVGLIKDDAWSRLL